MTILQEVRTSCPSGHPVFTAPKYPTWDHNCFWKKTLQRMQLESLSVCLRFVSKFCWVGHSGWLVCINLPSVVDFPNSCDLDTFREEILPSCSKFMFCSTLWLQGCLQVHLCQLNYKIYNNQVHVFLSLLVGSNSGTRLCVGPQGGAHSLQRKVYSTLPGLCKVPATAPWENLNLRMLW